MLANLVCLLLAGLAGCGGGGSSPISGTAPSGDTTTPTPTPPTATSPSVGAKLNENGCGFQYTLTGAGSGITGNDPLLDRQWHLLNLGASGAVAGEDIRARAAWTITKGAGVRVAVIDDAVEIVHADLAPNVVPDASRNYRPGGLWPTYPLPCASGEEHGTSVAGLIAARDGNAIGVAGVAPRASLVVYNALATNYDTDIADALMRDGTVTGVYNNSWGSSDDGRLHASEATFKAAIQAGITNGRDGKGSIYTFPAGNGGCFYGDLDASDNCVLYPASGGTYPGYQDNANFDGYVNGLGVIPVCAVTDQGRKAWYSEPGANVFVCATSSNRSGNVVTTKVNNGYTDVQGFSGTSATTPMVAGAVALMLAARPELTWRDVRLILAATARKNDSGDAGWTEHFGYHFNHKYGFGVVDAQAAVTRAQGWTSVGGINELKSCGAFVRSPARSLPDGDASGTGIVTPVSDAITVAAGDCAITQIEFIEVAFAATHTYPGDLRIRLRSPGGLISELANARVCFQLDASGLPARDNAGNEIQVDCGSYGAGWTFGSVRHLGESTTGNWTLEVTDMQKIDVGTWSGWQLKFWGR